MTLQASSDRQETCKSRFEWTKRTLLSENETGQSFFLLVSNPSVPLPDGVLYLPDFVSIENEQEIASEIDEEKFKREGFELQRRVQRFRLPYSECGEEAEADNVEDTCPPSLQKLGARLNALIEITAQFVTIEDIPIVGSTNGVRKGEFASNHIVTTFESSCCPDGCTDCCVAYIPMGKAVIQHWNRPIRRDASCWTLESRDHWTDVRVDRGSAIVRRGECLHHWRSRFVATTFTDESDVSTLSSKTRHDSIRVIKFYTLPNDANTNRRATEEDTFGYIVRDDDLLGRQAPMPPMKDLLTVVITTSPVQSHPSTELLERAMGTFIQGGTDFAYKCQKVIVCDGFRTKDDNNNEVVSRKHANAKQAMRNGIVDLEQAENYRLFKNSLKELCSNASDTSPFHNTVVEELGDRHGYGFALRHALRHCVKTPFVCVVQHDRTFMRPTPVRETLHAMWNHPRIKYVGMNMRSNLCYRDLFLSKYGRVYYDQLGEMVLRPPELFVDSSKYGPDSASARAMNCTSEKVRESTLALAETYLGSSQYLEQQEWLKTHAADLQKDPNKHQLTLTPTLFWYDNIHIAETAHYRDFVFKPSYKMVARGGFVEDKLSPVMKRTVERLGLKEGHSRFGCFLLDDHSGLFFTGHLDGGSYITSSSREAMFPSRQTEKFVDKGM